MPGETCSRRPATDRRRALRCWSVRFPAATCVTTVTNGRLLVYDPDNLVTNADGSKTIPVLWDSQLNGRFSICIVNKFKLHALSMAGKSQIPNYNGGVDVYGLTP